MLKIRLTRKGKKRQPFYRIVVADVEAPRDGRYVELIGTYNPLTDPPSYKIKEDRALHWLSVGAQPTDAVLRLLEKQGTTDRLKRLHAGETIEVLYEEFAGEPLNAEKEEVAEPVKKAAKKVKAAPAKAEKVVEAAPVVEAAAPVVAEAAAVVAEPVVEAVAPAATESVESDKLTKIEGVGPKIAEVLNNNGIHTFAQLAAADADTVKGYLSAAGPQFNRHDPTTWGQQAGMAADGKWDELQKWQDELDGGKAAASDAVAEAAPAVEEKAVVAEAVVADDRTTDIETENTDDAQKATITVTGDDPSTPEVELSETTNVTVTERVIEGDQVEVAEYDSSVEDLIAKYASADESDTAESAEDLIAKYASDGDDAA